jgi:hypothetical protein
MVRAVQCGAPWFVLYNIELHGSSCTMCCSMDRAVQCGAPWFVLYNIELHGSSCTMWSCMPCTPHILPPYYYQHVRLSELLKWYADTVSVSGRDSKPRAKSFFRIAPQNSHLLISPFKVPCTTHCEMHKVTNQAHSVRRACLHSARTAKRTIHQFNEQSVSQSVSPATCTHTHTHCTYRRFTGHRTKTGIISEKRIQEQSRLCTYNATVCRVRVTILSWKHNNELWVAKLHGTVNRI